MSALRNYLNKIKPNFEYYEYGGYRPDACHAVWYV